MKKILTNIPLIISSLILIAGVILGALVIAQYHLETPTAKELRTQIDRVYNEITETDLNNARESASESEDIEKFIISEIESERNVYLEISAYQNGREYNNACKIVAKKLDIILDDINTDKINELNAYAAMIKIVKEKAEFKDISDVQFAEEYAFLATLLEKFILSAALVISGIAGVLIVLIRRHCKRNFTSSPESTE